jgi:diacylglycerol kinase (ATP)
LGILPTGTANFFAHDLGIPADLDRALKLLTGEHVLLDLDLMQAMERSFVMNLSVGLSSKTILQTEREQKKRFGMLAYAWNLIAILIGLRTETFNLKVDGVHHKMRASEIMVVNSSLIGIRTLPQKINILPDDGKVEICIIRARSLLDWLAVLGNVLIGHSERNTRFRCLDASQNITIKSKRSLMVQGDGELLGKTPLEVKVLPRALRVIIPVPSEPFINLFNPFNYMQNQFANHNDRKPSTPQPEINKQDG